MSAASLPTTSTGFPFKLTRQRIIAIALLLIGVLVLAQAFGGTTLTDTTTSTLNLTAESGENAPRVIVPTRAYALVSGFLLLAVGAFAALGLTGYERLNSTLLIAGGVLFIPTIVILSHANNSVNVVALIVGSFRLATPIAIGAMAGIWCERSGVVNIAIEGMMLTSACFGFLALYYLRSVLPLDQLPTSQLIAVIVAILVGGIVALLHAWLSITLTVDQIISGTIINILAVGVTSFVRREYLYSTQGAIERLPSLPIPILRDIPIIGDAVFNNQPIFYLMFVVIIGTHIILFHTTWGLRTRAVGEKPSAADTLGINVNGMRWVNVFIGGLIAGLAGAWFSLETTGTFSDGMTNGKGFIALAAMIFGKWTPLGAFGGALLFGFSDIMGTRFQIIGVPVPYQFLQMVPYILTLIVLAGLVGRAFPPKAIGKPYKKE